LSSHWDFSPLNGKLTTHFYYKQDDFSFTIVNLPFICNNIPISHAYRVQSPQLIWYATAWVGIHKKNI
jgi:hypothetical protein